MSILGKIFGEGLEGAGENIVKKAAKEASESTLSKIGKKIPVSYTDNIAQDIAVKSPEMIQVYRGMAAKTDDELKQYLSDMIDYNIKPRTYSGLNVSGAGYNFTTNPVAATKYANTNPIKESRVVLTTELPKNRFIQQNAANQNRLQDFISRAESRGIPYEGGASERAAKKDMEAYFKKNGLLGVRNNSGQIFVVNQNDPEWIDKLDVDRAMRGRRSNIVDDMALKNDLSSILKTADVQKDLDNAKRYISVVSDDSSITLYHGTPNKFDDFDESLPSVWFSDSDKNLRDTGLSIKGSQPMNIMERQLPKDLMIADEDLADRLTKQQLQDRGYAGIAYAERGPNGDETYYEIFNPNKTLRKMPDVMQNKGPSLVEMARNIKAMQASRNMSEDGIRRIGSANVAPVNPDTLPSGWKELEGYLDNSAERLPRELGIPKSKITKDNLANYLEEIGYDNTGTKDEMWKNALMSIDDNALEELYNSGGGTAAEFLQSRLPFRHNSRLTDATNYYIGNKGRTGRLDAEYSDRLGIGRSNTPMSDSLVNPYSSAGGDYSEGAFGTSPTWATGETGVSTAAHERMHAWQGINKFDWDEGVVNAIDELRSELKKFYHDNDTLKKYHGGGKLEYYADPKEQEARMLQSYLDNEGFTKTYKRTSEKGTEWGNEIKPAFDKFFDKLRALSKAGVALPAALLAVLALSSGDNDNKS
jgi:hypothetical protein